MTFNRGEDLSQRRVRRVWLFYNDERCGFRYTVNTARGFKCCAYVMIFQDTGLSFAAPGDPIRRAIADIQPLDLSLFEANMVLTDTNLRMVDKCLLIHVWSIDVILVAIYAVFCAFDL